jgi:phosphopantetheine adenylyltransferase
MPRLKSFKFFNEERENSVVIAFGRFQPPTIGHARLFDRVMSLAKGNNYRIYTSQSFDKKNPLKYKDKIKVLRKMFPKFGRNIIEDSGIKTVFDALSRLSEQGFTKVIFVAGSDRVEEFNRLLNKYNHAETQENRYSFRDGIVVMSSGDRDPDAEGVTGMSASKMREAASTNNFDEFAKGLPKDFKGGIELFNLVRSGLGLKESYHHRKHIQLNTVSEERENFIKGQLFNIGDSVVILEAQMDYSS